MTAREALEAIDAALLAFAADCDPTQKAAERDRRSARLVGVIARLTRKGLNATR